LQKTWKAKAWMRVTLLLLTRQKNMIRGTWLDVSFSSHVKKSGTRHFISFHLFRSACERKLFRAFLVGKSQYVYYKKQIQLI